MVYDTSLSSVFLTPGVAVGAAAAAAAGASPCLTCDWGDSRREPAVPVPVPVPVGGVPVVTADVLAVRALTRLGSVQSYVAWAVTCGRACARSWMSRPL